MMSTMEFEASTFGPDCGQFRALTPLANQPRDDALQDVTGVGADRTTFLRLLDEVEGVSECSVFFRNERVGSTFRVTGAVCFQRSRSDTCAEQRLTMYPSFLKAM